MLTFLHIQNLAIADELEIELVSGFNVMTGETGAGKSIVVDAVGLLSGGRAYREMIRTGAERAVVEGIFSDISASARDKLKEMDMTVTDNVTIKRIIHQDGPSRAFVNGELVPLNKLDEIGRELVQIHSQNDQQLLLQPDHHLGFLDEFGGFHDALQALGEATRRVTREKQAYRRLLMDEHEKNQEMDMLRFQIREIQGVDLKPDEIETLMERRSFLKHTTQIMDALTEIEQILNNEDMEPLVRRLQRLSDDIDRIARIQPRFVPYSEQLGQAVTLISEMEQDLAGFGMEMEEEGLSLDEIESRLVAIERIQKKYGETYEDIAGHLENRRKRLSDLEELEFRVREQGETMIAAHQQWWQAASAMSQKRRDAAQLFAEKMKEELQQLTMPDVALKFELNSEPDPGNVMAAVLNFSHSQTGMDSGEILISPNAGEDLKPLVKVASGGEVSRIMLAIKILCAPVDETATAVFDEVDVGIGGKAAVSLAAKLKELSSRRQVLCVTHLAQVAASADGHFRVEKSVVDGRTRTMVQFLSKEQRLQEIARMSGGRAITETSLKHAAELIGGQDD